MDKGFDVVSESNISMELNKLQTLLEEAGSRLAELGDRLNPCMRADTPKLREEEAKTVRESLSPIGERVRRANDNALQLISMLDNLLRRLEV